MSLYEEVMSTLEATSRTFFIPISRLPAGIQEAVASAYLCMRAIDEIEDHPALATETKVYLLRQVSFLLQAQTSSDGFDVQVFADLLEPYEELPEVTKKIGKWATYAPIIIAPRIWNYTAAMAERMAYWADNQWRIHTKADLDGYTFSVAGAVGLLICDVWRWFGTEDLSPTHAIHFGRGLQLVNIVRNRTEDLQRGVDLFPEGWSPEQMRDYAALNLRLASEYADTLSSAPFSYFIKIPLALAQATLEALSRGEVKLTRSFVTQLVEQLENN